MHRVRKKEGERDTYLTEVIVFPLALLDQVGELGSKELRGHFACSVDTNSIQGRPQSRRCFSFSANQSVKYICSSRMTPDES